MSGVYAAKTGRREGPVLVRKQTSAAPPPNIPDHAGRGSQRKAAAVQLSGRGQGQAFSRPAHIIQRGGPRVGHSDPLSSTRPTGTPFQGTSRPLPTKSGYDVFAQMVSQERRGDMFPSQLLSGARMSASSSRSAQSAQAERVRMSSANWVFEDGQMRRRQPVKAARKIQQPQKATKSTQMRQMQSSDSDSTDSDEQPLYQNGVLRSPVFPSDGLQAALRTLASYSSVLTVTKTLPFLARNLRTGFKARCRALHVAVEPPAPPKAPVRVIFQLNEEQSSESDNDSNSDVECYEAVMEYWDCPLCSYHGKIFDTRQMLQVHLSWDHSEVGASWKHDEQDDRWEITLLIPETLPLTWEELHPIKSPSRSPSPIDELPEDLADVRLDTEDSDHPPSATIREDTASTTTMPTPIPDVRVKFESYAREVSVVPLPPRRSSTRFATPILIERESPPPLPIETRPDISVPEPPLGPTARYPYLPAEMPDGSKLSYSCRPGGPRLYDLLGMPDKEKFGVLTWSVVDKEEELFEVDDVRDEDKVMQALWNRWIMLNRKTFIKDYNKGVLSFVQENAEMIKLAAGWAALRVWLMVLVVNRFLTARQTAAILSRYESMAGMDPLPWKVPATALGRPE